MFASDLDMCKLHATRRDNKKIIVIAFIHHAISRSALTLSSYMSSQFTGLLDNVNMQCHCDMNVIFLGRNFNIFNIKMLKILKIKISLLL